MLLSCTLHRHRVYTSTPCPMPHIKSVQTTDTPLCVSSCVGPLPLQQLWVAEHKQGHCLPDSHHARGTVQDEVLAFLTVSTFLIVDDGVCVPSYPEMPAGKYRHSKAHTLRYTRDEEVHTPKPSPQPSNKKREQVHIYTHTCTQNNTHRQEADINALDHIP